MNLPMYIYHLIKSTSSNIYFMYLKKIEINNFCVSPSRAQHLKCKAFKYSSSSKSSAINLTAASAGFKSAFKVAHLYAVVFRF